MREVSAVLVASDDGECSPIAVKRSDRGNWSMGKTKLHVHHEAIGVAMLSPVDSRLLQSPHASVFEFPLPAPLDAFVYPEKLIVARFDPSTQALSDLTPDEFLSLCAELVATSRTSEDVEAVYDVPAIPINYDAEEDDNDYPSEEEEIDESESADESIEEEDDDWDDDDDARSTA